MPGATVQFRSASLFFGRTHTRTSDGNGNFNFTGALNDSGGSVAIPTDGFALVATDAATGFVAPETPGVFGPGLLVADQNVIFSNSGILRGLVTRSGGEVVTLGSVTLSGGGLLNALSAGLGQDGRYLFRVVPPGLYTATATLPIPEGTDVTGAVSPTITAGATTQADIVLPATGEVRGFLLTGAGDAAVNQTVYLQRPSFQRQLQTGTGGQFSFLDVPTGAFMLTAYEPNTGLASASNVIVIADFITPQNLRFIGLGTVRITATLNGGPPALSAPVQIRETARGGSFRAAGNTDANGQLLILGVPLGAFTVRVFNPGNTALFSDVTNSVNTDGQFVEVAASVPTDPPPTAMLTAPQQGQSFLEGTTITLSANASDDQGLRRVEFLVDGQVVGSDTFAPYAISFQLPQVTSNRTLTIAAVSFDTGTNRTQSASVTITDLNDVTPPAISLFSPGNGASFREGVIVTLQASASDNVAVERVEFSANGVTFGVDVTAPYSWAYAIPAEYAPSGSSNLVLAATAIDPSGNTNRAAVTVMVISDNPPTVTLLSPTNSQRVAEGTTLTLSASAGDDVGLAQVEFYADGLLAGVRLTPPFSSPFQLPGGPGNSPVLVQAVAMDTLGQRATNAATIIRLDDTNAPTVAITAPRDGSIVTIGDSDVAIVIDNSGSTGSSSGADVDGDSIIDNILKAEIFSALQLLNFLNPTNTRVALVIFNTSATLRQTLTNDFFVVRQILTNVLSGGPTGGTDFNNAMRVATDELAGLRARRNATAVQLFLSDGSAAYPANEVTRAVKGGICVNTFAVGSGANPAILQQMATNTACVFTPVVNVGDLLQILPQIILFGINQMAILADASDDMAVRQVAFSIRAPSTGQELALVDPAAPYQVLFGLPTLTSSLALVMNATARDFGDNQTTSAPVNVTLLPAESTPQITMLMPASARAGSNVTILGKFFHPVAASNTVTFNGVPGVVLGGSKISLTVRVPAGAGDGPVVVQADGLPSGGVHFDVLPTGTVAVQVAYADGLAATNARVEILETNLSASYRLAGFSDSVGRISITNVAGPFTVRAVHPGNAALSNLVSDVITIQGQTLPVTISLPAVGSIMGQVRFSTGEPASNSLVRLIMTGFLARTNFAAGNGAYGFIFVPAGVPFTVRAANPRVTNATAAVSSILTTQGQTAILDLVVPALGIVVAQVNFATGAPATNAPVYLLESTTNNFRFMGRTAVDGRLTITNVAAGSFTVRGLNPNNTNLFAQVTETLTADGQTNAALVTLDGTGSVTGRVSFVTGAGVSNATVQFFVPGLPNASVQSGSSGNYAVSNLPVARPFTLRALHPTNTAFFRETTNNTLAFNGEVLAVNLTLPALATLQVTVLRTNGMPFAGARVNLRHFFNTNLVFVGTANSTGVLSVANVSEGAFTAEARDPGTLALLGTVGGAILPADNGQTVNVTIGGFVAPRFIDVTLAPNGDVRFRLMGQAGASYLLERSSDFAAWIPVSTNIAAGGFVDYVIPAPLTDTRRFYRASLAP